MQATFWKSIKDPIDLPRGSQPQVAMLGRSNAGKSSFVNHLANAKSLARVSADPGLTRTINLYDFEKKYYLVDLPGYGFTRSKPEKIGDLSAIISSYLSGAENLRLVLMVIDARHGFTKLDIEAFAELQMSGVPYAVIANKIDQLSKTEAAKKLAELRAEHPGARFIPHSIKDNGTLGAIREIIDTATRRK